MIVYPDGVVGISFLENELVCLYLVILSFQLEHLLTLSINVAPLSFNTLRVQVSFLQLQW